MYIAGKGQQLDGPGTSLQLFSSPNYRLAGGGGLGCACKGGGMGCSCRKGMGLFDSGTDFSQWGIAEWATVAVAGYMVFSTLFTTRRAVARVGEGVRRTRKRVGKRISG